MCRTNIEVELCIGIFKMNSTFHTNIAYSSYLKYPNSKESAMFKVYLKGKDKVLK